MFDTLIRNALVVFETECLKRDIAIQDGLIAGVLLPGQEAAARRVIDAEGLTLMPGGIDTHTHFFQPGPDYREDVAHGTMAASAGGYTTVMDMPNTDPPVHDAETYALKQSLFGAQARVDYGLWGASMPGSIANIGPLAEAGCLAFKAFTLDAGPTFRFSGPQALYEGLLETAKAGSVFAVHAEDPDIVAVLRGRYEKEPFTTVLHDAARPWYAELSAINTAVLMARLTGCPLHLCHTSIPEGVALVAEAKAAGADITIETCPHYLLLDCEQVLPFGPYAAICPPIRSRERVEQMWEHLAAGNIDYMGTDHAPYTRADKEPENLWNAPGGSPNIDVALPMVLDEAIHRRGLGLPQMARFFATNAARRFGLYPQKGTIRPGSDADLILVDTEKEWTHTRKNTLSKTKETAFAYEGRTIKSTIEMTMVRGLVVYENSAVTAQAPQGQQVLRQGRGAAET